MRRHFLGRYKEAMECIKECYTLWAMNHLRNPGSMRAALALIQSCLHNKEFEDAEHYARHAYFMIAEMTDNFIPSDQYPQFLADVSHWLAVAIVRLAETTGIPPGEKQKVGEEAIEHARKALELYTQLGKHESREAAAAMGVIAEALDVFNNVDDDEILRLYQQSIAIIRRLEGLSPNVGAAEIRLGAAYGNRANRAEDGNDRISNLGLARTHFNEAARIYRVFGHTDTADTVRRNVARAEEEIRQIKIDRAAVTATKG